MSDDYASFLERSIKFADMEAEIDRLRTALAKANKTIDDLIDAPEPAASGQTCEECGLSIEECNKRALTRWRHRGDQTKEIERLRSALSAARASQMECEYSYLYRLDEIENLKADLSDARKVLLFLQADGRSDGCNPIGPWMDKINAFLERTKCS